MVQKRKGAVLTDRTLSSPPLEPTQRGFVPGYVAPPTQANKTSARPSLKQLLSQLEQLRGPDAFEARALIRRMEKSDRRAFLEAAIADAGGTPLAAFDAAAPILRSKGQRRTEHARKARSPDHVAHAVVRKALDDMDLSGRGAPAAQKIRDWALALLADHRRLAAHRDRQLSPAGLCRVAGVVGLDGGAPSLQNARAAAHMLAAQLPGVFGGGLYLRRYLRFAKGLAAQQSVTPRTVADAWASAQNASSVESAAVQNGAAGREGIGAGIAELSRIRVPGPLTSEGHSGTRTRACSEFLLEPGPRRDDEAPAQAGPAEAAAVDEGHRAAMPPGEKDGSAIGTPGAPAALAGEEAGRAPASSAGARRAQPPGGHAARVLTDSVWRAEAQTAASACGLSPCVYESVLAFIRWGGELGRNARDLARLVLDVELERHGVVWSGRDLRVLAGDVTRLVRFMLSAGLLLRTGGSLCMPVLATPRLLGLEGLDARPSARLASSKMLDCLERWGVPRAMAAELSHDEASQLQKKLSSAVSEHRRCPRLVKWGQSLVWDRRPCWTFSVRHRKFSTIAKIEALGLTWMEYEAACLAGHGRIPRKPLPVGWGWSDVPVANALEAAVDAARCGPGMLALFREVGWSQGGAPIDEPRSATAPSHIELSEADLCALGADFGPGRRGAQATRTTLAAPVSVVSCHGEFTTCSERARGRYHSEHTADALGPFTVAGATGTDRCFRPRTALVAGETSPPNAADWREWIERVHAALREVGRRDTAADAIDLDEAALLFADLDDLAANEHPDAADLDFPGWAHIDADDDMADFEARRTGT